MLQVATGKVSMILKTHQLPGSSPYFALNPLGSLIIVSTYIRIWSIKTIPKLPTASGPPPPRFEILDPPLKQTFITK